MNAAFTWVSSLCFAWADQDHTFERGIQRRDGFAARARRKKIRLRD
jgi:hypothetical protein